MDAQTAERNRRGKIWRIGRAATTERGDMARSSRLSVLLAFSWLLLIPAHGSVADLPTEHPTPQDTVVLANRVDTRFCRDFSPMLNHLRLEWVVVERANLPEAVHHKNLILLGRPQDPVTGEIMRRILSEEEIETLRATSDPVTIEKNSPWAEGRRVFVCSGGDSMQVRDAADQAARSLLERSPPASGWIRSRYEAPLDDDLRAWVDELTFTWDVEELPLAELTVKPGRKASRRTSTEHAVEDVQRLFYLFSHGYSGYAYFNRDGVFERAEKQILHELSTRPSWSSGEFSDLLYNKLAFITDCHLKIGTYRYGGHIDFWYDTSLELMVEESGYEFTVDEARYSLVSVNGEEPAGFVFPSLNAGGEAIYRLGTLAKEAPGPIALLAKGDAGERSFEIDLARSDYDHYARSVFREDRLGGIPVIRVRGFGSVAEDQLRRFVETGGAHRGEPVLIVDARGNGGGDETWPIQWIQGLTGRRAESVFIFSELHSKTTMAGRANLFADLRHRFPGTYNFEEEAKRHAELAESFDDGSSEPYWVGPYFPELPLIPNDTTVVIVTNGHVASAGEGLVMRASQAENVVLVGENTQGCLTFGNASAHRLPHSGLRVSLPISFGIFPDGISREEAGLAPDIWVPAADAVNYAVAAVRNGTISTHLPLPATLLREPFIPEDPWARSRRETLVLAALIALYGIGGNIWAYVMRNRPRMLTGFGVVWLAIGGIWLWMGKPIGIGFLLLGVACLLWGGINLVRARRASRPGDQATSFSQEKSP